MENAAPGDSSIPAPIAHPASPEPYGMFATLREFSSWLLALAGAAAGFSAATAVEVLLLHSQQKPAETTVIVTGSLLASLTFVLWKFAAFARESERMQHLRARDELIGRRIGDAVASYKQKLRQIKKALEHGRDEEEAALMAEWDEADPFDRLIRAHVFCVYLTGAVVRAYTSVCNVYDLPKMLSCVSSTVHFRVKDANGGFADVATPVLTPWSAVIPARSVCHDIPEPIPVSVTATEADAIRNAAKSGSLDVIVVAQYAVTVGRGATEHPLMSEKIQFPVRFSDG